MRADSTLPGGRSARIGGGEGLIRLDVQKAALLSLLTFLFLLALIDAPVDGSPDRIGADDGQLAFVAPDRTPDAGIAPAICVHPPAHSAVSPARVFALLPGPAAAAPVTRPRMRTRWPHLALLEGRAPPAFVA
jgi:hypothetical protein